MKTVEVVVIGFVDRAEQYTKYAISNPGKMKVKAVIDPNPYKRTLAQERFSLPDNMVFEKMEDCLKLGKIADAVINATMDELHISTAIPFLELGYDMLLEKPITNNKEELLHLAEIAKKHGCKLMICHVLRYAPFYLEIKKVLLSGEIGEIIEIESNEMVEIPHASASYIRGKWNNRDVCGSSMLLAKCCHDMDLMCWYDTDTNPVKVASFGGRYRYVPSKAPAGAGTRCLVDCQIEESCPYSCRKIHLDNECYTQYGFTCLNKKYEDLTYEEKKTSLEKDNPHGRCIYKTDSNIVDRQAVVVEFDNGSIATHSMVSGVARLGRWIHIIGTMGEIEGYAEQNCFRVRLYQPETCKYTEREVKIDCIASGDGHHGGDSRLVADFVNLVTDQPRSISSTVIEDSINGHLIVYAADESLDNGGVRVLV